MMVSRIRHYALAVLFFAGTFGRPCAAQSKLSLQEAIDRAIASRASLKAEAERVSAARGFQQQAGLFPNPQFQFSNENLRPGQDYSRDVDTLAVFTQPLDILGKRKARITAAASTVGKTQAELQQARLDIVQRIKLAYWAARGAQESQDLLKATVDNFKEIVDYHTARFSVGAISEQDLLRVRLESERLQITANLATIEATRARVTLLKEMGQTEFPETTLTEPLDANSFSVEPMEISQVLNQRIEMRVARAAVDEAQAKARLEDVSARPDLDVIFGYKRTQPADASTGLNTAVAGLQITLPIGNRNQGNRAASSAELRRQQQLLAGTEAEVRADYFAALQEYELRHNEVVATLEPLRQHAQNIAEIGQAAYEQGGFELLRLLDAQRSRLDAELAYVQGMVAYKQSIANLQAAEGANQ